MMIALYTRNEIGHSVIARDTFVHDDNPKKRGAARLHVILG